MNSHQRRIQRRKKSPRFQWQNLKKLIGKVRHRTLVAVVPTPESVELARIYRKDHLFGSPSIGIPPMPKFKLHSYQEEALRSIKKQLENNGPFIVDAPWHPSSLQDARSRLLRDGPKPEPLIIDFEADGALLKRSMTRVLESRKRRDGVEKFTINTDFTNLDFTNPEGESNGN